MLPNLVPWSTQSAGVGLRQSLQAQGSRFQDSAGPEPLRRVLLHEFADTQAPDSVVQVFQ